MAWRHDQSVLWFRSQKQKMFWKEADEEKSCRMLLGGNQFYPFSTFSMHLSFFSFLFLI
jgi:hypothetical protein